MSPRSLKITIYIKENSMTLENMFGPLWLNLRTFVVDGTTYYVGVDVRRMIPLSNLSAAIAKDEATPRVSTDNWIMEKIISVNKRRSVYLLKYQGIKELIRNNKNGACKRLKLLLDE